MIPHRVVSTPVRIALVGGGVFAHKAHVPALKELKDLFEVVAVGSRTEGTARRLADAFGGRPEVFTDLAALCARSDVEAVDLVLPIPAMPAAIRQALGAGKHVISEKPVATSIEGARELIAFHDATPGMDWMVAENWRYEAAFVDAAAAVHAGRIGDPILCHWAVQVPIRPGHAYHATGWRRTGEVPGGFLLDAGVHFVAVLRMVLGEITDVAAFTRSQCEDLPPADTLAASLRFERGTIGTLAMTYAAGAPFKPALHVVGTDGSLRVSPTQLEVTDASGTQTTPYANYSGIQNELTAFAARIRRGTPHRGTPHEALRDLTVTLAWLDAAATGRNVRVPLD